MAEENNEEEYFKEEDFEKSEEEEDVYKEEDVEEELEQDEIAPAEAGFMEGYDRRLEKEAEDISREEKEGSKRKKLKKSK
jgi:hypothetical protein